MKSVIFLLLVLLAVAYGRVTKAHLAPLLVPENPIADQWMIVFYPNTSVEHREKHMATLTTGLSKGESINNTWNIDNDFLGYHGVFSSENIFRIRKDPIVKHVEQNGIVTLEACTSQSNSVWNLHRLTSDNIVNGNGPFNYDDAAGTGVTIYIIDTGILLTHNDFGGRATFGVNYIDTNPADCNGHGTHVAGTTAGTLYGVSKISSLVAVKVLNCQGSGTLAGVTDGINWVAQQPAPRSVVNLSLGGGFSATQNTAINSLATGDFVAVAAGNSNTDLANTSPASAACTGATWAVGATAITDVRATFSNYGACLTVFAPGQSITSDWIGSNTATSTISGTSMASPLVAGAAALLWSQNPTWTAATLRTNLASQFQAGRVINPGPNTPNNFIHYANC